eukprot:Hpha_TRINITY_DN15647_c3_g1::TRINITY_DN15647_c3_g1_i1::g.101183::m.101183
MTEEDKEYLRRNNIHQLLDSLAKDIIDRKPENPQVFVINWLRQKEDEELQKESLAGYERPGGGGGGAGAGGEATGPGIAPAGGSMSRKAKPATISVPETPQKLSAATLKEWLEAGGSKVVVVDVREKQDGGKIAGSEHHPNEALEAAPLAEKWKELDAVVFCSNKSPDLDLTAGIPVMQALQDLGSQAQVYLLHDGLVHWISEYKDNEKLVADFDQATFERLTTA